MRKPTYRRNSLRLKTHDYRLPRFYFVTVAAWGRRCLFGAVERGRMYPNDAGRIVEEEWRRTADLRPNVDLDAFIVMPNHFHGIVQILHPVDGSNPEIPAPRRSVNQRRFARPVPGSLSTIVGSIKAAATRRIRRLDGREGIRVWQRGFDDRIIRSREHLDAVRRYIRTNPRRWAARTRRP